MTLLSSSSPEDAADFATHWQRLRRQRLGLLAIILMVMGMTLILDLTTGPSALGIWDLTQLLINPETLTQAEKVILWNIRLPQALMAVIAGGALGLAGAETQTALNNPLASPFTLGISGAAVLGATLAIITRFDILGLGPALSLAISAFVCALAAGGLILALSRRFGANTETVILFGVALLFTFEGVVDLLRYIADAEDVQQSVLWRAGSLARADWTAVTVTGLALLCIAPFTARAAWAMTVMRGGEDQAQAAGIAVERLRLLGILRACLLTGIAVAFIGAIGFIGLVAPHIARMILGEDHRFFLPGALLTGAILMSLASIASKIIAPGVVIPAGIVTTLVGVPVFMVLVMRKRRGRS